MLLSLKWLQEFVPFEGTAQELGDRLTMLGLELEEIIYPFAHLDGVVTGHVVQCGPHPEADRLSVTRVDTGAGEPLAIVCGAPNVAKGQKVAVATIGTTLPGGITIKKSKLRGQVSMGMICAEDELGLGTGHDGIMVLDEHLTPGLPLAEALDLDMEVLDIGVTPNRSDCNSVLGLAREVALAYNLPLHIPKPKLTEHGPDMGDTVKITIADPDLCPLFSGRIIKDITVGPSPAWLRWRLLAIGQRPVNNIVDASNYIMFELGHPNHAYDLDLLEGPAIFVSQAGSETALTTLDGQVRTLRPTDLLIRDAKHPVGLAGIMGGSSTEVSEKTKNIFLELAVFHPPVVRKTARGLGLGSEASYRFERGMDQQMAMYCLDRVSSLVAELGEGKLITGLCKAEPKPWQGRAISFSPAKAKQLLGIELSQAFCVSTLTGLGCIISGEDTTRWEVTPPSHRPDLTLEADLCEELARVYGMDTIPAVLPRVGHSLENFSAKSSLWDFTHHIKNWARGIGLTEAINFSFVSEQQLNLLGLCEADRVPVANPLSEDQGVMRSSLLPGLLANVRTNAGYGAKSLRLFEVAHAFTQDKAKETTVAEALCLAIVLYGQRNKEQWPWPVDETADYADLKGLVEHLLAHLGPHCPVFRLVEGHHFFDPCVTVQVQGKIMGTLGRINKEVAAHYNARYSIWAAELDMTFLKDMHNNTQPGFTALDKFPAVRRDITINTPHNITVEELIGAIYDLKTDILENVTMVDLYEPENEVHRNITLRLTYRHKKKTLKDKDVDKQHRIIASGLQKKLPVQL